MIIISFLPLTYWWSILLIKVFYYNELTFLKTILTLSWYPIHVKAVQFAIILAFLCLFFMNDNDLYVGGFRLFYQAFISASGWLLNFSFFFPPMLWKIKHRKISLKLNLSIKSSAFGIFTEDNLTAYSIVGFLLLILVIHRFS